MNKTSVKPKISRLQLGLTAFLLFYLYTSESAESQQIQQIPIPNAIPNAEDNNLSESQEQTWLQYLQPIQPPEILDCFQNGRTPNWKFCEMQSIMPNQEIRFENIAQQGILILSCKKNFLQATLLATPPEKSRKVTFHHPLEQNRKIEFRVEEIHGATLILDNQSLTRWLAELDTPEFAVTIGDSSDPPEIRIQQRFSWPGIQEICLKK